MNQLILLALSTFISEDLACIGAGLLVAGKKISLLEATLSCLAGIFAGDLALVLAGRLCRGFALRLAGEARVAQARTWLERRGPVVAFLSRFTPGLRLPTYTAAGAFSSRPLQFALWMLLACCVWVPALVTVSAYAGEEAAHWVRAPFLFFAVLAGLAAAKLWRREPRRKLVNFVRKMSQWEFWPVWLAYMPVVIYCFWLAVRYRSLTLFTAANPGIYSGGFCEEPKSETLAALRALPEFCPAFEVVPAEAPPREKIAIVSRFLEEAGLGYPLVLKPERGERGTGVAIIRDAAQLEQRLRSSDRSVIVQEFVPGLEFGLYFADGRLLGLTEKVFPAVIGDGRSSVGELVRRDSRARLIESVYRTQALASFDRVPREGEAVPLVEIGAHCRGTVFLDGRHLMTAELEAAVARAAAAVPGFFLGRLDVKAESAEGLQAGRFRILEVNGVTGEPTYIYDPRVGIVQSYAALFRHWRLAFEIGDRNRRNGARPMPPAELWAVISKRMRQSPATADGASPVARLS